MTLLLLAGPAAASNRAQSPRAFVSHLYERYRPDKHADDAVSPTGLRADTIFEHDLLRLIRKDQAQEHGEVGLLDYDPICDCQDSDGFRNLHVTAVKNASGKAKVIAYFSISADRVVVSYDLVRTPKGWRVFDIHTKAAPSLRGRLASK